ncbi:uncharacterized protein N7496_001895 [Penicillium cataractarum]|uniref:Cell cycle inhibitor Nif1 n=1 Tax=Penicillium cataractarum TaxID=2100454 RepID=A0A9W9VWU0_9EURO|nr:uncharacterized protein N7496_001895 [Penicillium cataractarum]KAJ5390827.1 hypothetical protein N7496_001895 [Penicillium cataractarum]
MSFRGNLSDCRSTSHDTLRSGMPSPRIEHYDGEVPPRCRPWMHSPPKAAHEPTPPSSVARSLSTPRPGYFRAPSSESQVDSLTRKPTLRAHPDFEEPKYRPVSEHPRFSSVSHASSNADSYDDESTPRTTMVRPSSSIYDIPRAESPEDDPSLASGAEGGSAGNAMDDPSRESSTDSVSRLHIPRTLAPPVSPHSRPSSSARVNPESSDDDYSSSNAGSTFSKPRKLSSGSAVSLPYSPMSTYPARMHPRSPSMSSETSATGHLPRPSFNFSRPLSRSSTSLSAPGPSATSEPNPATTTQQHQHRWNQQSHHMHRPSKPTPILVPLATEEAAATHAEEGEPSSAVSSYVYAKYALPRGRMVSRDSVVFAGLQTPHFEWQEPLFENSPPRHSEEPPRSARTPPPSHPRMDNSPKPHSMYEVSAPAPSPSQALSHAPVPETKLAPPAPISPPRPAPAPPVVTPPRPSVEPTSPRLSRPSVESTSPRPPRPSTESTRPRTSDKDETVSSADSASTLRPQTATTQVTQAPSTALTADDHVTKGIELHEAGSLNESTYHLRIAAKQNNPTGMLLYALACRHGWGMRPNQQEGVRWLRKAVDSVGLEMLENPDAPGASKAKELQKAYRAQFALSIYELGVSHLNGWGIEQDKSLALRCFEIAGKWGDVDAMAEAGFCYAEGVGCKKDMKKAARFYREAESKGMSMVGNSWIYKDKYMPDDERRGGRARGRTVSSDKKPRSKSRTRSLFQRKKSVPEA